MKTSIVDQAKRLAELVREFDSLDGMPESQDKTAFLIGARLLSMDSELRSIAKHIDPSWRNEGGLTWKLKRDAVQ